MVQEQFQSPVCDAGRLQAQRQYVFVRKRVRVDKLNRVLVLGPVNGDGRHLPGHERLEHDRLVRVVVRPELFAADHRTHVVPELGRSVQHVAPPDTHAGHGHALGRGKVREEPVQELFVAHHFQPRDRPLDPVRGHAVADGRAATEPRILDSATAAAATTAAAAGAAGTQATAGTAAAQHVGDAFHDAGAGARGPGRRTGRTARGTTAGRRRRRLFVGRPQSQPVDPFRQFRAGTFHDALTGHGDGSRSLYCAETSSVPVFVVTATTVVTRTVVVCRTLRQH